MRKLATILFFLCLGITQIQAQSVVVTEINNSTPGSNEWIELYIVSGPVSLNSWSIRDYTSTGNLVTSGQTFSATAPELMNLATGTRIVISNISSDTEVTSGSNLLFKTGTGTFLSGSTSFTFTDSGTDALLLRDNTSTMVHALGYGTPTVGSALETLFANSLTSNTATSPTTSQSVYLVSDNPLDSYVGVGTPTKGATNSALPIELTTFQARAENEAVQLSWTTASESNNDRFEVQERVGNTWNKVSEVKGNGTSTVSNNYAVAMQNLEAGYHTFRLKQVDYDGKTSYSDEVQVLIELQDRFQLSEAYPNPFNPSTSFSLTVAKDQQVQVQVYDMTGRLVATLFNGQMKANEINRFSFDAQNLASGVYFYRTVGENFTMTKKMLLMK